MFPILIRYTREKQIKSPSIVNVGKWTDGPGTWSRQREAGQANCILDNAVRASGALLM